LLAQSCGWRSAQKEALRKVQYPVRSLSFDAKPANLIRAAKELGIEGIIAKREGTIYKPGEAPGCLAQIQD
jgi:hypothetical protein